MLSSTIRRSADIKTASRVRFETKRIKDTEDTIN
jgi:hypothetical protein